jgi:amino-acid N-acetyltransferase
VLVHGARPQIDAEMARRGLEPRFHHGLRVTDAEALECVKSAMAVTRFEVEALLSQGLPNTPMAGSYIRVTGGNFITARPVGVVDGVDYQYTGAVRKIIAEEINADLDQQNVVLITPLGVSPAGEIFNLAMEEVAEAVAVALKAEKLIYLCDAPGLLGEDGQLVESVTADEAQGKLDTGEGLTEDLHLFLPCAIRAVRKGVARCHLIDHDLDGGLLLEFFTHAGVGTVVSRDPLFRLREATVDDVGALVALITPMEADGTLVRRGRELLEQEIERFTVVEHDGVLVGCAALYPFSEDNAAELACLAVTPEYRRAGLGDQLLKRIERARACSVSSACSCSPRAPRTGSASAASARSAPRPCRGRSASCTTSSVAPRCSSRRYEVGPQACEAQRSRSAGGNRRRRRMASRRFSTQACACAGSAPRSSA